MKKQLPRKFPTLHSMITSAMSLLLFIGSCSKDSNSPGSAQTTTNNLNIVYTDLISDSVIVSESRKLYNLDLNNDGIVDFVFAEFSSPVSNCRQSTGIRHAILVKPASGSRNAMIYTLTNIIRPLDSLTIIDANAALWSVDTFYHVFFTITTGPAQRCNPPSGLWQNNEDNYLGLRFIKDDKTYYGWARLNRGIEGTSLTLKDYAYNNNPGKHIFAGQIK
jgi:hypothetical protein